jgi:hypothetical protein
MTVLPVNLQTWKTNELKWRGFYSQATQNASKIFAKYSNNPHWSVKSFSGEFFQDGLRFLFRVRLVG